MEYEKRILGPDRIYGDMDDLSVLQNVPHIRRGFELKLQYELRHKAKIYALYGARMIKASGWIAVGASLGFAGKLVSKSQKNVGRVLSGAGLVPFTYGMAKAKKDFTDAHNQLIAELCELDDTIENNVEGGYMAYYTMTPSETALRFDTGAIHERTIFDRLQYLIEAYEDWTEGEMVDMKKNIQNAIHLPKFSKGEMNGLAPVYSEDGTCQCTMDCTPFPQFTELVRQVRNAPGVWSAYYPTGPNHPLLLWYGVDILTPMKTIYSIIGKQERQLVLAPTPAWVIREGISHIGPTIRIKDSSNSLWDPESASKHFQAIKRVADRLITELISKNAGHDTKADEARTDMAIEVYNIIRNYELHMENGSVYMEKSAENLENLKGHLQSKRFDQARMILSEYAMNRSLGIRDEQIAFSLIDVDAKCKPFGAPLPTSVQERFEMTPTRVWSDFQRWQKDSFKSVQKPPMMKMDLFEWSGATSGAQVSVTRDPSTLPTEVQERFKDCIGIFRAYPQLWSIRDGRLVYRGQFGEEYQNDLLAVPFDDNPCVPSLALTCLAMLTQMSSEDSSQIGVVQRILKDIENSTPEAAPAEERIPLAEMNTLTRFLGIADRLTIRHARDSAEYVEKHYSAPFSSDSDKKNPDRMQALWNDCVGDYELGKLSRWDYATIGLKLGTLEPDALERIRCSLQCDLDAVYDDTGDTDRDLTAAEAALVSQFPQITYLRRSVRLHPDCYEIRISGQEKEPQLYYCGVNLTKLWSELPVKVQDIPDFDPTADLAPNLLSLVCFYLFNGYVAYAHHIPMMATKEIPEKEREDIEALLTIASTANLEYREHANEVIAQIQQYLSHDELDKALYLYSTQTTDRMEMEVPERQMIKKTLDNVSLDSPKPFWAATVGNPVNRYRAQPTFFADPEMSKWQSVRTVYAGRYYCYSKIRINANEYHLGYCSLDLTTFVSMLIDQHYLGSEEFVKGYATCFYDLFQLMVWAGRVTAARTLFAEYRIKFIQSIPLKEYVQIQELLYTATAQPAFVENSNCLRLLFMSRVRETLTPSEASALDKEFLEENLCLALTPSDERTMRTALRNAVKTK